MKKSISDPNQKTWTLVTCLDSYDVYIDSQDQYGIFKDILSASPEGLAELANLQKKNGFIRCLNEDKGLQKEHNFS